MKVGITITTHNRRDDLARTLERIASLDPAADEILVCADGCTDETATFVRERHPHIRVLTHDSARGSVASRNDLLRAATCDVCVSFDDDSYPLDNDFIARVRKHFTDSPRLAVLSFAQRTDEHPMTLAQTDFGPACFVGSFANSASAIRRPVFLELGGYPEFFFHAYEEPDFALRCVCAGWQVRWVPSPLVRHHYTGAQRSELRMHQRHSRNEFWSIVMRCPFVLLFPLALFRALRQFGYACSRGAGWALREPLWWAQAIAGIPRCVAMRDPLPLRRYLAWLRLLRVPIESEAEWNARFHPDVP